MIRSNSGIAIKLTNISKQYTIHHEKPTLVEKFYKGKDEKFWALKNICLTVKKGEKVGIIGPNGSGKTTLLKIITGITTPSSGQVETNGKVVSLIDLEAGFHPDLTGLENIYLNGLLLGMKKKEINSKLNTIIKFAGIHQFIDAPLFTYSQGMKLRLGFSIAINSSPDVMILDEGFMAGDEDFRHKSLAKISSLTQSGITVLMVSQWLWFIQENCRKIIWFKNGRIAKEDKTKN